MLCLVYLALAFSGPSHGTTVVYPDWLAEIDDNTWLAWLPSPLERVRGMAGMARVSNETARITIRAEQIHDACHFSQFVAFLGPIVTPVSLLNGSVMGNGQFEHVHPLVPLSTRRCAYDFGPDIVPYFPQD